MIATAQAYSLVTGALRALGFRGARGVYSLDLAKNVSGRLGVTCTKGGDGTVSCWAVAGVRHESIYARGVELGGYPASATNGTLAVAMKYLCGGGNCGEYLFRGVDISDRAAVHRLRRDVDQYALPFFSRLAQPSAALRFVELAEVPELREAEVFVPIALLEQGKTAEAVDAARAYVARKDATRGNGKKYALFFRRLVDAAGHQDLPQSFRA